MCKLEQRIENISMPKWCSKRGLVTSFAIPATIFSRTNLSFGFISFSFGLPIVSVDNTTHCLYLKIIGLNSREWVSNPVPLVYQSRALPTGKLPRI